SQENVTVAAESNVAAAVKLWKCFAERVLRNRQRAAVSAVALLLILAGVAGFLSHRHRAKADAERVQHSPDETPESAGRRYVANGARLLDEGDNFGALVWFVEALKLHRGIANEETNDRLRIGSVLRQSPKLLQVWCPGGPINSAEFSQDGHLVLAAVGTNAVWVWNTETGKAEHSPLMHKGNRPVEAHFSPDGQTIVSVNGDSASLWSTRTGDRLRTLSHIGAKIGRAS